MGSQHVMEDCGEGEGNGEPNPLFAIKEAIKNLLELRLDMGNLWVQISHTIPKTVNTIFGG